MLSDPREIEIIAKAVQKNVRDPRRARKPFDTIFADFGLKRRVRGQRLLDLGPGQFDFAVVASSYGAAECVGIDMDPAVVELGCYKKLPTILGELRNLADIQLPGPFDGVFCKYSIDAFWFAPDERDRHSAHVAAISGALTRAGWSWIAPWNGGKRAKDLSAAEVKAVLDLQRESFAKAGYEAFELTEELSIRYGVHGVTVNRPLFTRGLEIPADLRRCLLT
jgi:hypothetical protein